MTYTATLPTTTLPCTTLPTKADFTNFFNQIAQIPADIRSYLVTPEGQSLDDAVKQQLNNTVTTVETYLGTLRTTFDPFWTRLSVEDVQKEISDAFDELIHFFHVYIPGKMLELINSLIPVSFTVNILGISVNLLNILDPAEWKSMKQQVSDNIDAIYALIPAPFNKFKGDYGIDCADLKAKCTWQYFANKVVNSITGLLHSAFADLISAFQAIWDALSLPSLPALLDISSIPTMVETFLTGLAGQSYDAIVTALNSFSVFGKSLLDVIGGAIDDTVQMGEDAIDQCVRAANDWAQQWQKEIINDWIKKIKAFLDAIGIGALFDLLSLTFCDILTLLGIPTDASGLTI